MSSHPLFRRRQRASLPPVTLDTVTSPLAGPALRVTATSALLAIGDTVVVSITVTRVNAAGALTVTVSGLTGVTASALTIAAGQSTGTLTLTHAGAALGPQALTVSASNGTTTGSAPLGLTVVPTPVASVTVTLGAPVLVEGESTTATATLRAADSTILTGRVVTWASSAPSVATVHPTTGVVTTQSPGSAVVSATSEGVTGSATITVEASVAASIQFHFDAATVAVAAGATASLPFTIARVGVTGSVTCTLTGLPSDVTAAPVVLADGVSAGAFTLTAAAGAAGASYTLTGAASAGDVVSPTATVGLTVQGAASAGAASQLLVSTSHVGLWAVQPALPVLTDPRSADPFVYTAPAGYEATGFTYNYEAIPEFTGDTHYAPAGTNLTTFLAQSTVKPGDTVFLQPGAVYASFRVPFKENAEGKYIRIATDLTAEQRPVGRERVAPSRHRGLFATLRGPIYFAPGVQRWLFRHVDFRLPPGFTTSSVVRLYSDGNAASIAEEPRYIIFDQVLGDAEGSVGGGTGANRVFWFAGEYCALVNSHISNVWGTGESHAMLLAQGTGRYEIVNNFLEGATQCILFGGAETVKPVIPADVIMRRNHMARRASWDPLGASKVVLEYKEGVRTLAEGNVFEGSFPGGQDNALYIKSQTSHPSAAPSEVRDLTWRANELRRIGNAVRLGKGSWGGQAHINASRLHLADLFVHDFAYDSARVGLWLQSGDLNDPRTAGLFRDVLVERMTAVGSGTAIRLLYSGYETVRVRNSVLSAVDAPGRDPNFPPTVARLDDMPDKTPAGLAAVRAQLTVDGNVFYGPNVAPVPEWPDNAYLTSASSVGFANPSAGDYRIPTGPYAGKGANHDEIARLTAGVRKPGDVPA